MKIAKVHEYSIAADIGLVEGDELVSVNGLQCEDDVDLAYLRACNKAKLILRASGELIAYTHHMSDGEIGLDFDIPAMVSMQCRNNCIFCFVQQLPPHVRSTMCMRDDDYRMSLIDGNFITLTNLSAHQMRKICKYKLSPLYISVHTVNDALRQKMMNYNDKFCIKRRLSQLWRAGIQTHLQIVLCPQYNDGKELEKTFSYLARKSQVSSVAIVPVGLSDHRQHLTQIQPVSEVVARRTIYLANAYNTIAKRRVFLPADEFYIVGKMPFPSYELYGDFPHYENGVGIVAKFVEGMKTSLDGDIVFSTDRYRIATGLLAKEYLYSAVDDINKLCGRDILALTPIENHFFGKAITVSGLVTGSDIMTACQGMDKGEILLVPDVMLKDKNIFLDDTTIADVATALGVSVKVIDTTAEGLISAVSK